MNEDNKKIVNQSSKVPGGGYFSLLKDKLSTINKTNLKVRLKVVISTILVGLFIVLLSTSYALWTISSEKSNVFTIVVGDLSYRLTCDKLDSKQEITIPSNGTRTVVLNISSLNNISSTYKLYYTNNDGIEANYYKNNSYTGSGTLEANETVGIKVILKNNTNINKKVKIGVQGGLLNKDLVLSEGVGITIQVPDNDIILAYNYVGTDEAPLNFPVKGLGYEVTNVACQNAVGSWDNSSWSVNISKLTGSNATCNITYTKSNPNAPELLPGMIPVTWNGSNWVKAGTNWYNYQTQMWANAVTVTEANRNSLKNSAAGTVIPMSDINTMWVWIPKYEYKIEGQYGKGGINSALPGEIEVNFVTKTDITPTSGYTLHPAFNFGGENLSGIWVGKFEPTGNINSPTIKPNEVSLRDQNVSSFFTASRAMQNVGNPYGFSNTKGDTHMMKNMEWGAVAYLTQSKYGKYGNPNYTGANKEVYQNKSSGFITGSSNGTPGTNVTNTQVTYNVEGAGTGASTTGTIYGVYDMSGGALEYTMGVLSDPSGKPRSGGNATENSGFKGMYEDGTMNTTGLEFPNNKYYDLYTGDSGLKGDATNADGTQSWYGDYARFVSADGPWFLRGGSCDSATNAGVFYASLGNGNVSRLYSSRVSARP